MVLSCNTGEGHNAAGRAVYEKLKSRREDCEFLDTLSLVGERASRVISKCYVGSTRIPVIFHGLYVAGGAISSPRRKSPVYYANSLYREKLLAYLEEKRFDAVVTPHLFPAEALTSLRREQRLRVKTLAVATDYTSIPFWEETELDAYVVPHPDVAADFMAKGVPRDKIVPIGIPVRDDFRTRVPKEEARRRLQLPLGKPLFLVMSGSMGFGRLGELTSAILERFGGGVETVILCGRNDGLRVQLERRFLGAGNVRLLKFTDQVPCYMDACDVLFTKPGGLTSTEAAVKNIPIVHTAPIPGCETKNAAFFSSRGMSFYDESIEKQLDFAEQAASDGVLRENMLRAQRENTDPEASGKICDYLKELCG